MSYKSGYSAARRGTGQRSLRSMDAETLRGYQAGLKTYAVQGPEPLGYCDCGNRAVRKKSQIPVCQRCLDIEASYDSAVKTRHDHAYSGKERGGWE